MNFFKKLLSLSLTATLLFTGVADARSLSGVTTEWAPHYGSAMLNGGAMTVITQEAFRRGGHDASLDYIAWNRALRNVEEGQDDFVMGAYYNEERAKTYIISEPVYYLNMGLVALNSLGFDEMESLQDLRPYNIGISRGYANTPEFDEAEFLTKSVAGTPKLNLRKLYRNRIDMMVGSFDVIRYEARAEEKSLDQLVFVQPPLERNALYLLVSRAIPDGEQLVEDFNRGLAEMQLDGTLDALLAEYLGR